MTRILRRARRRQRAQGMTEYIIIVGLVAIALIVAVDRYRQSLDVAIQGTTDGVNGVRDEMENNANPNPNPNPQPPAGAQPVGNPRYVPGTNNPRQYEDDNGDRWTKNGSSWEKV